jgi:hypothetical protein
MSQPGCSLHKGQKGTPLLYLWILFCTQELSANPCKYGTPDFSSFLIKVMIAVRTENLQGIIPRYLKLCSVVGIEINL